MLGADDRGRARGLGEPLEALRRVAEGRVHGGHLAEQVEGLVVEALGLVEARDAVEGVEVELVERGRGEVAGEEVVHLHAEGAVVARDAHRELGGLAVGGVVAGHAQKVVEGVHGAVDLALADGGLVEELRLAEVPRRVGEAPPAEGRARRVGGQAEAVVRGGCDLVLARGLGLAGALDQVCGCVHTALSSSMYSAIAFRRSSGWLAPLRASSAVM